MLNITSAIKIDINSMLDTMGIGYCIVTRDGRNAIPINDPVSQKSVLFEANFPLGTNLRYLRFIRGRDTMDGRAVCKAGIRSARRLSAASRPEDPCQPARSGH